MADNELTFEDLPALYAPQTEAVIADRWAQWANEAVYPEDENAWVDTRPGSLFDLPARVARREFALLYDYLGFEVLAASMVAFSWGPYLDQHAVDVNVLRSPAVPSQVTVQITGTAGTGIPAGAIMATEPADPTQDPVEFVLRGQAIIPVAGTLAAIADARIPGALGNVPATSIVAFTPPQQGARVTNALAALGGSDTQSDSELLVRLRDYYRGRRGGGRVADYRRWALDEPGVGGVIIRPRWNGAGTMLVIIYTAQGTPVTEAVRAAHQQRLDPVLGMGYGLAPPQDAVTVKTSELLNVTITGKITLRAGASLSVAQQAAERTLATYVARIESGELIHLNRVLAAIVTATGVDDLNVATLLINGVNASLLVAATPNPQVARLQTVTLTI